MDLETKGASERLREGGAEGRADAVISFGWRLQGGELML